MREIVSLWFGLCMLVASYLADRRTREDFAFWGYLFGMFAFWGGLTSLDSDSELGKFLYCCINLFLMGVSVVLQRRVFIVFGSIGVFGYLGHLAGDVFEDTLTFTFALSALGLIVIFAGLQYHRHRKTIEEKSGPLASSFHQAFPSDEQGLDLSGPGRGRGENSRLDCVAFRARGFATSFVLRR